MTLFFLETQNSFADLLLPYLITTGNLFIVLIFLPITKLVLDICTPFDDDVELTEKDNVAFSLTRAGEYLAVILIIAGALYEGSSSNIGIETNGSQVTNIQETTKLVSTPKTEMVSAEGTTPVPKDNSFTGSEFLDEILWDYFYTFLWAGIGLALLIVTKLWFVDKILFPYFSISKEVINDQNPGAGAIEAAALIATGIIIACAISGENLSQSKTELQLFSTTATKYQEQLNQSILSEDLKKEFTNKRNTLSESATVFIITPDEEWKIADKKQEYTIKKVGEKLNIRYPSPFLNHPFVLDLTSAIVFWFLGCLLLFVFTRLYEKTIGYSLHDEVEKDNISAGVSFAFNLTAIALIVGKGVSGNFVSMELSIEKFIFNSVLGFFILLFFRTLIDRILLPDHRISDEIVEDQNLSVSFVEGFISVGIALVLFLSL